MAHQAQNMIKYILKRIFLMVPILLGVLIFTWILSHMMSINPALNQLRSFTDTEGYQRILRESGYYDPWFVKLGIYLRNFFNGNWGESHVVLKGQKVLDIIGKIWPKTIELMFISIVIVPFIAIKLGIVSASNKNKLKDNLIRGLAIFGAGIPIFYVGTLAQLFIGIYLQNFTNDLFIMPILGANEDLWARAIPSHGIGTGFRIIDSILYNNQSFLMDTLNHLLLPAFCMIFVSLSGIVRQTRSSMLDVLDQDYIRTARAKGVPDEIVINKHALRNAILPTSHIVIGSTAYALLGSLFIELIFNYMGMGYYQLQAIYGGDYFLINGILLFQAIVIISGTLIADVAYTIIDPRIIY